MKRITFLLLLFIGIQTVYAQEKDIQGIVFDVDSKQRLTRVYIYNTRTHKGFYNNLKGEFTTRAQAGDVLVAALEGYRVDTLTVKAQSTLIFYLKSTSILLKEVVITDSTLSAEEKRRRAEQEYKDAYRKGSTKDILQIGGANGMGGAGLGIDALWSLLSREGKNARFLQKIIERDYKDQIVDYRYTRRLVADVTGLGGTQVRDFMEQYRPSYNFILAANDYDLIEYVKSSYQKYKRNPAAYRIPPLTPISAQ